MTVCGITAEYNPFHTGHLHHIAETRRSLGENAVIVCVMSGNFVQRGDFAVLDKYARAEMAVRCGADLVVELPLAAALSSNSYSFLFSISEYNSRTKFFPTPEKAFPCAVSSYL